MRGPRKKIVMLAYDEANVIDITGPLEMMGSLDRDEGAPPYAIELIAERAGPFRTTSGLELVASRGFAEVSDADLRLIDTLIVAGGNGTRRMIHNAPMIAFIAHAAAIVRRVASVCSGGLLLGKAGLLKGRRATTHWCACDQLRELCPEAIVHEDALYVHDGSIWTSAGVTAGMDLALALIEDDFGREAALNVAQNNVMFMMRPGGQSQFSETLISQAYDKGRLGALIAWIRGHLKDDLSVPRLAEHAGMTERTLARAFIVETGETPARFVERLRVDAARTLLAGTDRFVETVAVEAGFGSIDRMRRAFKKHLNVSPSDFRNRFGTAHRIAPAAHSSPHPHAELHERLGT